MTAVLSLAMGYLNSISIWQQRAHQFVALPNDSHHCCWHLGPLELIWHQDEAVLHLLQLN